MKKEGFYSSGEFAKKANVTVRTIRYYDKQNILKPSLLTENGSRFYTDDDFVRLQQILLLKYLGFSLEDIRELTIGEINYRFLRNQLGLQSTLIQDKIEQMQNVQTAIQKTMHEIECRQEVDWTQMLELIHLTSIESSLKGQYQNAKNINARIQLHDLFSKNPNSWFPWLYSQAGIKSGMRVLEVGCGNGAIWTTNKKDIPSCVEIWMTDASSGMVRDARRNLKEFKQFNFKVCKAEQIPFENESFDVVMANHMLFYCGDISKAIQEIHRVLKPHGKFLCSTYGANHMREISFLIQEFDPRIVLSGEALFERFGLDNGEEKLDIFKNVEKRLFEDELFVTHTEPLVEYILSCHGNQNHYLLNRYKEFKNFVSQKIGMGIKITKEAGIFVCEKE